jgi:hypothetical protein
MQKLAHNKCQYRDKGGKIATVHRARMQTAGFWLKTVHIVPKGKVRLHMGWQSLSANPQTPSSRTTDLPKSMLIDKGWLGQSILFHLEVVYRKVVIVK